MKLQPNFEQYKKDQEQIDKIPTIRQEFHFFLNDIALKIVQAENLTETERNSLEIVYEMTQALDNKMVNVLDHARTRGDIDSKEFLFMSNYFLLARQHGPQSQDLLKIIYERGEVGDFSRSAAALSIPAKTKELLVEIYKKIKGGSQRDKNFLF